MGWPTWVGWVVFFLVPVALWAFGSAFARSDGWDKWLAFIVAGDNRLSLSRLQAFVWTLVIFGSFVAAMAVHEKITAQTPDETTHAKSKLAKYIEAAAKQEPDLEEKQRLLATAKEAEEIAGKKQSEAEAYEDSLVKNGNASATDKEVAKQRLAVAKANKVEAEAARKNAEWAVATATRVLEETNAKIQEWRTKSFEWVFIPAALLALAGIAIGSGIFSNFISAVNADNRSPEVDEIAHLTEADLDARRVSADQNATVAAVTNAFAAKAAADAELMTKTTAASAAAAVATSDRLAADRATAAAAADAAAQEATARTSAQASATAETERLAAKTAVDDAATSLKKVIAAAGTALIPNLPPVRVDHTAFLIRGKDLGKSGAVRLTTGWGLKETAEFSPEMYWKDDGTEIIVEVPKAAYKTLIVDTPNGKVCHAIDGEFPALSLGSYKSYYEIADLFRDDKDTSKYDLMKFQMFGWTVIAVFIYGYLFLRDLGPTIHSLPVVPESIVWLTGLSQVGYLGSKAVSNVDAKKAEAKKPEA